MIQGGFQFCCEAKWISQVLQKLCLQPRDNLQAGTCWLHSVCMHMQSTCGQDAEQHDSKHCWVQQESHMCHDEKSQDCNLFWRISCHASIQLASSAHAVDRQGSACKNTMLSAESPKCHMMWEDTMKEGWEHLSPPASSCCSRSEGGLYGGLCFPGSCIQALRLS